MEKIATLQQYQELMNRYRGERDLFFSNHYFLTDDVERYIKLERMYFAETDAGIVFLYDEERYYRACVYVNVNCEFEIPKTDKKVMIRNVFRANKKDDLLLCIESQFERMGFVKTGTTVQLRGDVEMILNNSQRVERFAHSLERKGFRFEVACEEEHEKIEQILLDSQIIKDYHLDYLTPEEKTQGTYLCLKNSNNEICAASTAIIKNGVAQGIGIAIEEKYKMQGLAPVLTYYRMKWLHDNHIKSILAWALIDNEASLRYHGSLGYKITNRYAEEWIRE